MAKEETKHKILEILVSASKPSTLAYLAKKTGVSTKSIRNYLDEIEREGILQDLLLVKKPNVGVYLEEAELKRAELRRKLNLGRLKFDTLSPEARQQYILKTLFKNRYTYTIQLLADDLYVSKSTIVQDLVYVQKWLENHGLLLQRKPNRGLWIEGDEYIFRRSMGELFAEVQNEEITIDEQEIEDLDYRISFINYKKIKEMFPKLDLARLQFILQQAEAKLGYCLTEEAFVNLIIHIAIAIDRLKQEKEVKMEEQQLKRLAATQEFEVAQEVVTLLQQVFGIKVTPAEVGYVSLHLLGARVQQNIKISNYEEILESENQEFVELAQKIIGVVGGILDTDLSKDRLLLTGLALHLRPTIMRLRYGIKIRNPVLGRIKHEFTSIFGAAWAISSIFERMFDVTVNEDEVGYIAMHIGAAIERMKQKIRTIVICASGTGTAQLVAVRLERELPEIEIVETISANRLNQELLASTDLVVSTIGLREKYEKVVLISTLVDQKDICLIRKAINRCSQTATGMDYHKLIADIIGRDFCFLETKLVNKQEIIKHYGTILQNAGLVKEGFTASVMDREKITSTDIGKGIAIPHATDEYIVSPKICIIKLTNPVDWGTAKVDLVFLLALRFQDVKITKEFFKMFYSTLDDDNVLRAIRKAGTAQEIMDAILRKGEEYEENN